jgi:hypothetical protein
MGRTPPDPNLKKQDLKRLPLNRPYVLVWLANFQTSADEGVDSVLADIELKQRLSWADRRF